MSLNLANVNIFVETTKLGSVNITSSILPLFTLISFKKVPKGPFKTGEKQFFYQNKTPHLAYPDR